MILYLLSDDSVKANKAENVLEAGGIVSVQVLNEVVSVCQRKLKMSWPEIDAVMQAVKACVQIEPLTQATHEQAVQICKHYQLSFYDANICAAAQIAGVKVVFSEDMQDGMVIDGLEVKNPFNK